MKIKILVAAVALAAVSSVSNAAIMNGFSTDGEFFVTVLDKTAQTSYALDLGFAVTDMLADPTVSRSYDLAADANYSYFLNSTNQMAWTVTAVNNIFKRGNTAGFGFMYTSISSLDQIFAATPNKIEMNGAMDNITLMATWSNQSAGDILRVDQTNSVNNVSNVAVIGEIGYAGVIEWGATLGNRGIVAADVIGNAMTMYSTRLDSIDTNKVVIDTLGEWNLTAAGMLTYNAPSAVPVPAAVWLFGSGLIGLVGVARRKKA